MARIAAWAALWFVYSVAAWAGAGTAYTFGIGPVQTTTELAQRWIPVIRHLSAATGHALQFQTTRNISSFQSSVMAGAFDFAFINPYHYLKSHDSVGYEAFARERNGSLVGLVVVRKDSAIGDLAQLDRQPVAFPAPHALAATWLPMNSMRARGIEVQPHYVHSMDSVYLAVARGLFPAGGGEMRTFNALAPATRDQLRIIWRAEPMPPFVFVVHPRVPQAVVDKVQAAMVSMDARPSGQALLRAVNLAGVEKAADKDYDPLRKMNLVPPSGLDD